MAQKPDVIGREILPIPDRPYTGLITYDAKDPDTHFPPIEPLRPPVLELSASDPGVVTISAGQAEPTQEA